MMCVPLALRPVVLMLWHMYISDKSPMPMLQLILNDLLICFRVPCGCLLMTLRYLDLLLQLKIQFCYKIILIFYLNSTKCLNVTKCKSMTEGKMSDVIDKIL